MRIVKCPQCEKRYRISDDKLGKALKCRQCGKVFKVAAGPPVADPLSDLSAGAPAPPPVVAPPPPPPPAPAYPGHVGADVTTESKASDSSIGAYMRDVVDTLVFSRRGANVASFAVIAVLGALAAGVLPFAGCIGLVGAIAVHGWIAAFMLNTVVNAAGGDDELPTVATTAWWDGVALPLIKYALSWTVAWLPLLAAVVYAVVMADLGVDQAIADLASGVGMDPAELGLDEQIYVTIFYVASLMSIGFWPMTLLVVAVGGIPALVRIDLMIRTIVRSFAVYCLVALLAVLGLGIPELIAGALVPGDEELETAEALVRQHMMAAAVQPLVLYGQVFVMRAVGLYYHHFKSRFAWSWG